MQKTQTPAGYRELTATETKHLRRLYRLHEESKGFTQSMQRLDRLNAYETELMDDGVPAAAITAVLHS